MVRSLQRDPGLQLQDQPSLSFLPLGALKELISITIQFQMMGNSNKNII